MIASRIGRAATRFGPTRFGGSSSAMIGSTSAHSASGARQIGARGFRSCFVLAMLHLLLTRPCSPHASLEIVTKGASKNKFPTQAVERRVGNRDGPWAQGVVPGWADVVAGQVEGGHAGVGDGFAGRVDAVVEGGTDGQPGRGGSAPEVAEHGLPGGER